MTATVRDVVLNVTPETVVCHFDTLAPSERLRLEKALVEFDAIDVVWFDADGESMIALVPVEKAITKIYPGYAKYIPKGDRMSRSEAGRKAANIRWAGHVKASEMALWAGKGIHEVTVGPGSTRLDYTEFYAASHPDPALSAERAASLADPGFRTSDETGIVTPPLDPNGKDSLSQFVVMDADGKPTFDKFGDPMLTPERKALWDAAIASQMLMRDKGGSLILDANGQPQKIPASSDPTATFMGGGPATGKSSFLNSEDRPVYIPPPSKAGYADPDRLKALLPEYAAMARSGDTSLGTFSHEESSSMNKRLIREFQAAGIDYVYDGAGDSSIESLGKKVRSAQALGYKVNGVYLTLPTEAAVDYAAQRGTKVLDTRGAIIGRVVPPTTIREIHRNVSTVFKQAVEQSLFDSAKLFDSTVRGNPRLVVERTKGQAPVISDNVLWNNFANKRYVNKITNPNGSISFIANPQNNESNALSL